jgi:hypothetical protein
MWENQSLGSFTTPRRALSGLVGTQPLKLGPTADEARSKLPADLQHWIFVQVHQKND